MRNPFFVRSMVEKSVKCFIIPKTGFKPECLGENIHLSDQEEITIGRDTTFGIKDLACSKKQLILQADVTAHLVKIRRIGRNPSLLAGIPMEQDKVYLAREGMQVQVSPNSELMIKFETIDDSLVASNPDPTKKKLATKFTWSENSLGSVLFCETHDVSYGLSCKIASFDLDGTIILTKSGHTFPANDDDWKLWHPTVKVKLATLVSEGFNLVLFTNQAQLEVSSLSRKQSFKKKIENVIKALDVPFTALVAMTRDKFRKPAPGMWHYLLSKLPNAVDMKASFYVGDAAGRVASSHPKKSADFEITDRLFARNVGIKFYTPEEFFLNEPPKPFKDVTFHPCELPTDKYPDLNIPANPSEVIVMVGSPASGKSHFTRQILEPKGYDILSRDELKVWTKCRNKLIQAIERQQNVVYDATNPDKASRKNVLDICRERQFTNVRCFLMTTSEDRCVHNNRFRQLAKNSNPVPHTAIVTFNKKFEEPTIEEGFVSIVKIPFVPNFNCLDTKELYTKYLLGKKK